MSDCMLETFMLLPGVEGPWAFLTPVKHPKILFKIGVLQFLENIFVRIWRERVKTTIDRE